VTDHEEATIGQLLQHGGDLDDRVLALLGQLGAACREQDFARK